MENFNNYRSEIDFSEVIKLFTEKGVLCKLKKNDYFVRQNESSNFVGYIESGTIRYTYFDANEKEHVVGYSFAEDFVCDYPSIIKKSNSITGMQAVTDSVFYVLSKDNISDYLEKSVDTQRFGRMVAESMFLEVYNRLISFYRDTPEERYRSLIKRHPDILNLVSLKEIASFIGVTPETVSHIRRKLLRDE